MALFKIFKGQAANLPTTYNDGYCYFTIDDGKMYIDTTSAKDGSGRVVLNAAHADTASSAEKLTVNAGSSTRPVYFSGGVPVQTGTSLAVSVTGNAATATKLKTARNINLTDADGTNTGTGASFNGSAAVTLKLPAIIKANIVGNLTGKADSADALTANAGSSTLPVYFSGGVPVATGTSLAVSVTGSAAKWTTKRNFTISDGTNTSTAVAVDGSGNVALKLPTTIKAALTGNADTATNAAAADKLNTNAGDKNTPVYFSGGVPVACTSLDLNTTGSAAKWTAARKITITDGTNTSTAVNLDGSADVALNLPATIKATLTGNADTATNAAAADKLNSNAGSTTLPVYFSGGVPVATGTSLAVNITKNAATATKWKTARNFYVADADATNTGVATSVDGSVNATLKLPATIKANLTGNADTATKAGALSVNGGSASNPVYFSGGVPTPVTSIAGMTSVTAKGFIAENDDGNSITINPNADMGIVVTQGNTMFELTPADLSKLNQLANKTAGTTTKPIYFNSGVPTQCNDSLDVNISGTAAKASALNTNAGDVNTPVYFDGGVPVKCTSLDLNTSGNAATATKWATARTINITDADGTNSGTAVTIDGTKDTTLKLPATIKANLTGNADIANKLNSNAGSTTVPVYFDGGIPNACTSLSLNTTGSAATLTTARNLTIMDYSLTYEGGKQPFDGSTDVILEMPSEFEGTLHGNADSATKLTTAAAGDANTPVYFTGGKPVACTGLDLNTTGNAATATKLATARTIRTNLGSTSTASFDGSGNITPGVTGTLPLANGGLGATTASGGRSTLGLTYAPAVYTIDLSAYANTNFYLMYFESSEIELDCIIWSHGGMSSDKWNQNYIHFQFKANGWSDSPYWLNILGQGSYQSKELTIMNIVHGSQNGLKGVYLRGGLFYTVVSNHSPSIATSTYTYGNESYGSGTTSYTTLTNAGIMWTNDGSTKSSFSAPLYGAVWNDYAEFRSQKEEIKPGYCVASADDGQVYKTTKKFQACDGIVSDTFGFAIGETDNCKTPLAVAGRVLAYYEGDRYSYHSGDTVCAGPDGKVVKMTREEIREWPDRIIGIVSEIPEYETWGTGNVAVDGRIWIKIK